MLRLLACARALARGECSASGRVYAALEQSAGVQHTRIYSTSFFDVPHPSTLVRIASLAELSAARSMLPHRSAFVVQFTPHGVQLMPQRLPAGHPHESTAWHAGSAGLESSMGDSSSDAEEQPGVLADSVKRKRRLKMKKHKVCTW